MNQNRNCALVGVVANPISARDIRRLVANASSMQVADRANIVLRLLAALGAVGVREVVMMPDKGGVRSFVDRGLTRERNAGGDQWPQLRFLDMPVSSTVNDTLHAVRMMVDAGAGLIIVLGGDGTHRAVASRCDSVPIAGLSTGTNNAFPDYREPTITGLAAGLYVTGRVSREHACVPNKALRVDVNQGAQTEMALVDVAITSDRYVGARALWKPETFRELFVAFAEPHATGMSAIAGLLHPVGRRDSFGLQVRLGAAESCDRSLLAPIAPGLMSAVGIRDYARIEPGQSYRVRTAAGAIALDGEREIEFGDADTVFVNLTLDAFFTLDVEGVMAQAARDNLLQSTTLQSFTPQRSTHA